MDIKEIYIEGNLNGYIRSEYVEIVADYGNLLTDGHVQMERGFVLEDDIGNWKEIPKPMYVNKFQVVNSFVNDIAENSVIENVPTTKPKKGYMWKQTYNNIYNAILWEEVEDPDYIEIPDDAF